MFSFLITLILVGQYYGVLIIFALGGFKTKWDLKKALIPFYWIKLIIPTIKLIGLFFKDIYNKLE